MRRYLPAMPHLLLAFSAALILPILFLRVGASIVAGLIAEVWPGNRAAKKT